MKIFDKLSPEKQKNLKLIIAGIVILTFGLWMWHTSVDSTPERVFYGMLDGSMQTYGVTKYVKQTGDAASSDQYLQLELGANSIARSLTTIERQDSGGKTTKVVSESIGTSDANYARYNEISTPQKSDFSPVLYTWSKETADATSQNQGVLAEAVYGAVPFVRLNLDQRDQVVKFIRDNSVYKTDFSAAKKETVYGKLAYTYSVDISTRNYIKMLKMVDGMIGLNQLSLIDENSYAGSPDISVDMSVGIDSRQLLKVHYSGVERDEHFSGYGVQPNIVVPASTISRPELEKRLQAVLGN